MPQADKKQLLMEGADAAIQPTNLYVRQGDRVCFLQGDSGSVTESLAPECHVVESLDDLELSTVLVEGTERKVVKDGRWHFEGVFQRSDVTNANNRVYPRKVWERILGEQSEFKKQLQESPLVGHLEHPEDGRSDGNKGAIAVRDLQLQEDGTVWGRGEILSTPGGKILQEYTLKGVRWGVSSRGTGSVDTEGYVKEDYDLKTFDAVMTPSTPGAYPTKFETPKKEDDDESGRGPEIVENRTRAKVGQPPKPGEGAESLNESLCRSIQETGDAHELSQLTRSLVQSLRQQDEGAHNEGRTSIAISALERVSQMLESLDNSGSNDDNMSEELEESVVTLSDSLSRAHAENRGLEGRLEAKDAELYEAEQEIESLQANIREAADKNRKLMRRIEESQDEVETARSVLEGLSHEERRPSAVEEYVSEAVSQYPGLKPYRARLEEAQTVSEAMDAVQALCPAPEGPDPGSRPERRGTMFDVLTETNIRSEPDIKREDPRPRSDLAEADKSQSRTLRSAGRLGRRQRTRRQ